MIRTPPPPLPPRGAASHWIDRPDVPSAPAPLSPEPGPHLYGRGHLDEAQLAWQAHVDAGRIGRRTEPSPEWYRQQAEMERIFGVGRRGRVW